jgi:16S rRNA (cytidine1402-2'-O)-methyltransferase
MIGILYITATPIGNLEDMTLRAIRILSEVNIVLCEDTRTTRKLFDKYGIKTKTESYHSYSNKNKSNSVIERLKEGKNIALVSDAGTPCISDPGVLLVKKVYEEFGHEAKVITVPGASAVISALSISGISVSNFTFLGFVPHKKGRDKFFSSIKNYDHPVVFYESSHRIIKALQSIDKIHPENKVTVAKELTKIHENIIKGTAKEILEIFEKDEAKKKGEFVVIVEQ